MGSSEFRTRYQSEVRGGDTAVAGSVLGPAVPILTTPHRLTWQLYLAKTNLIQLWTSSLLCWLLEKVTFRSEIKTGPASCNTVKITFQMEKNVTKLARLKQGLSDNETILEKIGLKISELNQFYTSGHFTREQEVWLWCGSPWEEFSKWWSSDGPRGENLSFSTKTSFPPFSSKMRSRI